MTDILTEIVDDAEALAAKVKTALTPAAQAAKSDAEAIGSATLNYIETNGLQAAYQIALTVVGAMAPGASWAAALAEIEQQAVAAGKALASGASAIVASLAQSDLIAAGKLLPPTPAAA